MYPDSSIMAAVCGAAIAVCMIIQGAWLYWMGYEHGKRDFIPQAMIIPLILEFVLVLLLGTLFDIVG